MEAEVCLFPGQGSQHVGMGADLFKQFSGYLNTANDILGYDLGQICKENPHDKLNQTNYTQPALYVVNALSYIKHLEKNDAPDMVLGHSLGEYNALQAAEVFDFETGLKLVKKRGELMASVLNGGMAVIMGLELEKVEQLINNEYPEVDIANINYQTQIVISGPKNIIEEAGDALEEAGGAYLPLSVSAAFHSRYMRPLKEPWQEYLELFDFSKPKIEVISNVKAKPYAKNEIPELIIQQMDHPVQWMKSILYVLNRGQFNFHEIGPGAVLTNMLKKIKRNLIAAE